MSEQCVLGHHFDGSRMENNMEINKALMVVEWKIIWRLIRPSWNSLIEVNLFNKNGKPVRKPATY